MLFVGSQNADSNATALIDQTSGKPLWRLRSIELQELQGGITPVCEPLGQNPTHLLVCLNKPILYAVSISKHIATSVIRSILPGVISALATHPSGSFIFASIENKIFVWEVSTGQLLSIIEEHFQNITALKISPCGNLLASGSNDGAMKVFLTSNIITITTHSTWRKVKLTIAEHSCHTLAIRSIELTSGTNPIVLSVSMDNIAVLYSVSNKQTLLKILADCPLSACCIDPAQSTLFFGSAKGRICSAPINSQLEQEVITFSKQKKNLNELKTFIGHLSEITVMSVNADGVNLASGDKSGTVFIWEIARSICLRKFEWSRESINNLRFFERYDLENSDIGAKRNLPVIASLQTTIASTLNLNAFKFRKPDRNAENHQAPCRAERRQDLTLKSANSEESLVLAEKIKNLETELRRVVDINSELYSYVVNTLMEDEH